MQTYRWGNHKEGRKNDESPWYCKAVCILWQNILNNWKLRVISLPNPLYFTVSTWAVPLDIKSCHQQSVLALTLYDKKMLGKWGLNIRPNQENWKPNLVNGMSFFIAFSGLWSRHKWIVLIFARQCFLSFCWRLNLLAHKPSSSPELAVF